VYGRITVNGDGKVDGNRLPAESQASVGWLGLSIVNHLALSLQIK